VVWARTAISVVQPGNTFPVKTGMAAGSLVPLFDFLRASGKRIQDFRSKVLSQIDVEYAARLLHKKSYPKGVSMGKQSGFVTRLRNKYGPFRYTFSWYTEVPHFILNDQSAAPPELHLKHRTPWNVTKIANLAAQRYFKKALRQLPKLKDYHYPEPEVFNG